MDYGICLPNFPDGASREGMEAAERLGWSTVWTTDHLLVPTADADDCGFYAIRGTPEETAAEVRAFEALGVVHVALNFNATDPAGVSALAERFAREVAPLV